MTESNRRAAERVEAIVVLQLDADGRYGVTRDVSERGLLLATRSEFKLDDRLEVVIFQKGEPLKRKARVVRVEKAAPTEQWPFFVAMELDEPFPPEVIEQGTQAAATFQRAGSQRPPPARGQARDGRRMPSARILELSVDAFICRSAAAPSVPARDVWLNRISCSAVLGLRDTRLTTPPIADIP